ncbi:Glycerol-3-phosphate dehydrogenase [hydrothermal vent metagenome]|uniref:Glycerol-3-phosphate dehydrogenase n=1 Tax=hydrothermal vent metagenome TaxID=652676 RepID=A0A3B0SFN0_9ZZZZ
MNHQPLSSETFDVIIIGAGVVGCAVARRFVLEGARVAVVDKASDILDGASKANSAILHTGFDAPAGSLELKCIRDGYDEYREIFEPMGLVLEQTGAFVVGWSDEEVGKLEGILAKAHGNGVGDCRLVSSKELLQVEPQLASHAKAGIAVPGECIIDPWSAPYAYLQQALDNGAEVFLSCEVTGGAFDNGEWQLETSRGGLKGRHVVNCAGLYGDLVERDVRGTSDFAIAPRKGQFVVYDKAAASLLNAVILPVPTARTKGVVLFRTVFGNLAVGPTAEDQESRDDASCDTAALQSLMAAGEEMLPALVSMPVTATYAGLRPATQFQDYQIAGDAARNWISVGGIRSTGLSGALGIAKHVFELYGKKHTAIAEPVVPNVHMLAQAGRRDWQRAGYGEIVCHCELVTKREIEQALAGPLAARSLQGLKRQTRVTMGRCQGFYCSGRLAEITKGCFEVPIAEGDGDD